MSPVLGTRDTLANKTLEVTDITELEDVLLTSASEKEIWTYKYFSKIHKR